MELYQTNCKIMVRLTTWLYMRHGQKFPAITFFLLTWVHLYKDGCVHIKYEPLSFLPSTIRPRALAHIAQKVDIVRNKLIFSGGVHDCVLNHWLKVPENPPCRFFKIQDGVQNGRHFPIDIITLPPDVLETWNKCLNICLRYRESNKMII